MTVFYYNIYIDRDMNDSLDKMINNQTFDSMPTLFNNNKFFINSIKRSFNDRKYFHIIWNLLHFISTEYPNIPTDHQKQKSKEFITNLKKFSSGCTSCGNSHYIPTENEINMAVLSKNNFIQFLIDYHKNTNELIRRYNININNNSYTVDMIIQKYKDNDYNTYFKNIYEVDVKTLIIDGNLSLLYDKLIDIKKIIRAQENIEINISHKLN